MAYKGLLDILDEYFESQVNTPKEGINGEIEKYEACYGLLHSLMADLYEMGEQAGSAIKEPDRWEDNFDTYFNECIAAYIMNSEQITEVSDEYAAKYIPYEYTSCSLCGMRCFYNAYPEARETHHNQVICEHCCENNNN